MNVKHNILIALRNFKRNRNTFLINIVGLTSGMICILLIFLWINDELRMDEFHQNTDHLYEVMKNIQFDGEVQTDNYTPYRLASGLKSDMPEVSLAASFYDFSGQDYPTGVLSKDDKQFVRRPAVITDDFFKIFSFEMVAGGSAQPVPGKQDILLSETTALQFFETTEAAIGAIMQWKHSLFEGTFQVAGVVKDAPANSTLQFDVIFNFEVLKDANAELDEWYSSAGQTFLVLADDADSDQFNNKIRNYLRAKHALTANIILFTRKFSDRYLYGQYNNGVQSGGRILYVRVFTLIAIGVMLIACINFMNLATAQGSQRVKDIGVMKTLGSSRQVLIAQFLCEAFILALISLVIALVVVWIVLPRFNEIVGKQLSLLQVGANEILIILALTLMTGFLSGSYPAFYLTRLAPSVAMKGYTGRSLRDLWVRRGLVITQFTVSIVFIIGFFVTNKQIQYALAKDLGYKPQNVIRFQWTGNFDNTYNTFVEELKNIPGVASCSNIDGSIIENISTNGNFHWDTRMEHNNSYPSPSVGYDFIQTMGMEIIEGREFSKTFDPQQEMARVLVNEEALKVMALKDPIGKMVGYADGQKEIIGVVKNFHYGSLHDQLQPLFFRFFSNGRNVLVRIESNTQLDVIENIKSVYKKFNPGYPFDFTFLDDEYQALYTSEMRVADLSKYFTLFAVLISSLGLFALAQFTIQRRFREICIRKTYGASKWSIMLMLSKDHMRSVVIAIAVAVPSGYWILSNWLSTFYYRMDLEWWFFVLASFLALAISWLTIVGQTFRAAQVNPIAGLRE